MPCRDQRRRKKRRQLQHLEDCVQLESTFPVVRMAPGVRLRSKELSL
jgi:hypothetical protein